MAQIKIDDIVDHLSSEFKTALASTVRNQIPGATFSDEGLFQEFSRQIYRACRIWESVPDKAVKRD